MPIDTEIYCPRPPHDSHKNAVVKSAYRISDALSNPSASSSALRFLDVDATSGAVRTKLALDRKARCRLDVDLWNDVDGTSSRESSALRLSVVVARSSRSHDDVGSADADYELSVAENSPRGTHVGAVSPADLCLPMSGDADDHVVYRLVGKDAATLRDNSQSARWHFRLSRAVVVRVTLPRGIHHDDGKSRTSDSRTTRCVVDVVPQIKRQRLTRTRRRCPGCSTSQPTAVW